MNECVWQERQEKWLIGTWKDASLVIIEIPIKVTMKCHFTSNRTVTIQQQTIASIGEDVKKLGLWCLAGRNVK